MSVKSVAIESFAKFMVGGKVFGDIQRIVASYTNTSLTGEQKREEALKDIKDIGVALSGWLINLALELAVAWLKSKAKI